ncbi:hypothetical protein ACIRPK_36225 [Kitasatospora sp. NPDC101801]|uniref:hypothetical protein n=1 Tax=Kitasatospora sp. NPDC101801 TaxID=3364103 RepID=UPI0038032FA2
MKPLLTGLAALLRAVSAKFRRPTPDYLQFEADRLQRIELGRAVASHRSIPQYIGGSLTSRRQ